MCVVFLPLGTKYLLCTYFSFASGSGLSAKPKSAPVKSVYVINLEFQVRFERTKKINPCHSLIFYESKLRDFSIILLTPKEILKFPKPW